MTAETRTRRPWRLRVSVIAAVVVGIACAAPTAYAAWTAQATAKGSVSAGRVTATLSGDLASVLTNAQMTTTRSVTLTNTTAGTSTQPAKTSVKLSMASGDTILATSTTLVTWPTTAAAQCTPGAAVGPGSARSTWAAGMTMTSSLGRGQSTTYCVRTTAGVGAGGTTGTRSLVASASATVSVGSFSAISPTISGTVSTTGVWTYEVIEDVWLRTRPFGQTSLCIDMGGKAVPGASVTLSGCRGPLDSALSNQQFAMQDVGGQYAVLIARTPANAVLQATGSGVTTAARDIGAATQQWWPQRLANGSVRYLNLGTGTCLDASAMTGPLSMRACSESNYQRFFPTENWPIAAQDPETGPVDSAGPAVAGTSDSSVLDSPSDPVAATSTSAPAGRDSAEVAGPAEPAGRALSPGTPVADGTTGARVAVDGLIEDGIGDGGAVEDDISAYDIRTAQPGEPATWLEPDLLKQPTDD